LPLESFKGYLIQDYLYLVELPGAAVWWWYLTVLDPFCASECACLTQDQVDGRYRGGQKTLLTCVMDLI